MGFERLRRPRRPISDEFILTKFFLRSSQSMIHKMIERHDIVVSSVLFSVSSNFGVNAPQEVSVTRSEVSVYIYMRVSLLTSEICGTINIFFVLRPFHRILC